MAAIQRSFVAAVSLAISALTGCTITGTIQEAIAFAAYNQSNMEQDIAKGRGEYLESLSALLGVTENERPAFAAGAQSRFQSLIAVDDVTRLRDLRTLIE